MNKKVKTMTTWLAAAVFLFALAINVKVTMDDPFIMLSDAAIASSSSTSSGSWIKSSIIQTGLCYKCEIFMGSNVESICQCDNTVNTCDPGGSESCEEGNSIYYIPYTCTPTGVNCSGPF